MSEHLPDDWRDHVIEWVRVSDTRKVTTGGKPALGYNEELKVCERIENGEAMTDIGRDYGLAAGTIRKIREDRRKAL